MKGSSNTVGGADTTFKDNLAGNLNLEEEDLGAGEGGGVNFARIMTVEDSPVSWQRSLFFFVCTCGW